MKSPDGTTKQLCLRQGVHWNRGQATYVNIVDTHIFLNSETLRAGPKKVDTVLPQNRIWIVKKNVSKYVTCLNIHGTLPYFPQQSHFYS
jgi:hypothetical protein